MPSQRVCPSCDKAFAAAHVQAWLVYGTIPVIFSSNGQVEAAGVVTPTIIVKPGKELKVNNLNLVCPKCSFTGDLAIFPVIRTCELTGEPADSEIHVDGIGTVSINSAIREQAEAMFSLPLHADLSNLFNEQPVLL